MNPASCFSKVLPQKRWKRLLLEAGLIVAVILGAQYRQTRGLPDGAAPPLEGVRTDASPARAPGGTQSAGAGATATLVAFWAMWCPVYAAAEDNIVAVVRDHRVVSVPTHFVVDAAGNLRFRVVGYATTWGLKARLWWAETFSA